MKCNAGPSAPDAPAIDAVDRSADPAVAHEIAVLAYQIHVRRGATDGHAVQDWLEAETQLRAQQQTIANRPAYSL